MRLTVSIILLMLCLALPLQLSAAEAVSDSYLLIVDKTLAAKNYSDGLVASFQIAIEKLLGWRPRIADGSLKVTLTDFQEIGPGSFVLTVEIEHGKKVVSTTIAIPDVTSKKLSDDIIEQMQHNLLALSEVSEHMSLIQYEHDGTFSTVVPKDTFSVGHVYAIEDYQQTQLGQVAVSAKYVVEDGTSEAFELHHIWSKRLLLPSMEIGKKISPWRWSFSIPVSINTISLEATVSRSTKFYPLRILGSTQVGTTFNLSRFDASLGVGIGTTIPCSYVFGARQGFFANCSFGFSMIASAGVTFGSQNRVRMIYGAQGELSFTHQCTENMYWMFEASYAYQVSYDSGIFSVHASDLSGFSISPSIGFIW
ncbi:MAG: hypothetical protein PHU24_00685 [Sphaerochaetaceae bacterium]|nr:hypothetical protein [Sphaerochaetaceae bacterium]NLO60888.1 hypothetical protein [Spirochaetales bacterium]MDD2404952.1 hypothetical protein [Sphaerochaetaceae bacterium]MDD4258309.1 hypothetical protein [Sphaerochaetaceae bacterium]MDD4764019.1 hypothetical protein [Sphaerochaetaceae bacterium]